MSIDIELEDIPDELTHSVKIDKEKYKNFLEHECKIKNTGSIGGKYSYTYRQTSVGSPIIAKCDCGKEVNITDYGSM